MCSDKVLSLDEVTRQVISSRIVDLIDEIEVDVIDETEIDIPKSPEAEIYFRCENGLVKYNLQGTTTQRKFVTILILLLAALYLAVVKFGIPIDVFLGILQGILQ